MSSTNTLSDLRAIILDACDLTSWAAITNAYLDRWINSALRKVHGIVLDADDDLLTKVHKIYFATDKANYKLPSDFYRLRKVLWTDESGNFYPLRRFSLDNVHRYNPEAINTYYNQSLRYRLEGDEIWFAPDPQVDGRLDLHYVGSPQTLVNATDRLPAWFRPDWEDFIVAFCCIKCLAKEESDTTEWQQSMMMERMEIINAVARREENNPVMVQHINIYQDENW